MSKYRAIETSPRELLFKVARLGSKGLGYNSTLTSIKDYSYMSQCESVNKVYTYESTGVNVNNNKSWYLDIQHTQ